MLLNPGLYCLACPGASVAWTPLSLGSALIAWYKADAGVYSDAGTTLATNGQAVQQWNDQSGNGRNLQQATALRRPNYLTNTLNSLPVIDGTSDTLRGPMATVSKPVTLGGTTLSAFMVRKITSNNSQSNCRMLGIEGGSGDIAADSAIIEYCPGTSITTPTTFNGANKSTGTVSSGTWNQLGTIFDGVNNTMYIANTAQTPVGTTPTFAAAVDIFMLGNSGSGENPLGQMAEIIFTNTALTLTDRNNLATYFTNKWGV